MISKKDLEKRMTSTEFESPFLKVLAMESLPSGFSYITLDLDVRQISHILQSDNGYTRLCFKNGEIYYLPNNSELPRIKHLQSKVAKDQHVSEYLILNN